MIFEQFIRASHCSQFVAICPDLGSENFTLSADQVQVIKLCAERKPNSPKLHLSDETLTSDGKQRPLPSPPRRARDPSCLGCFCQRNLQHVIPPLIPIPPPVVFPGRRKQSRVDVKPLVGHGQIDWPKNSTKQALKCRQRLRLYK